MMCIDPNREICRKKMFSNSMNKEKDDIPNVAPKRLPKLEGFRGFVEVMVEEFILEDKPLDSYKEGLKKHCEEVGIDFDYLVCGLVDFLYDLNMGIKSPDGLAIAMAMASALREAEKCYVREEKIEEIIEMWNARHPNCEFHPHHPID